MKKVEKIMNDLLKKHAGTIAAARYARGAAKGGKEGGGGTWGFKYKAAE